MYIYIYIQSVSIFLFQTCLIEQNRQFVSADFIADLFKSTYESCNFWMKWIQEGTIFFLSILGPDGTIFGETNNEITNSMTSHIHWYQEQEEEQVVGVIYGRKILTRV